MCLRAFAAIGVAVGLMWSGALLRLPSMCDHPAHAPANHPAMPCLGAAMWPPSQDDVLVLLHDLDVSVQA